MILFYILLLYSFINTSLFIFYPIHYLDFGASIIAFVFCNFFKSHKRYQLAKYNLIKVFPNENKQFVKNNTYLSTKISLLNYFILFFGYIIYHYTFMQKYIQINIPEKLKNQEKTHGILLLSCHYGLFFILTIFLGKLTNCNCYMIQHKQKNFHNLLYSKSYYKINYIGHKNILDKLLNYNKNIIGWICDQKGYRTIYKFLNKECYFPNGPSYIFKKSKRKIWITFVNYNIITKKVIISFEELINIDHLNQNQITQKIADHFSEKILNDPYQYLWVHDIFGIKNTINNKNK